GAAMAGSTLKSGIPAGEHLRPGSSPTRNFSASSGTACFLHPGEPNADFNWPWRSSPLARFYRIDTCTEVKSPDKRLPDPGRWRLEKAELSRSRTRELVDIDCRHATRKSARLGGQIDRAVLGGSYPSGATLVGRSAIEDPQPTGAATKS